LQEAHLISNRDAVFDFYFAFITLMSFPSGFPMHLSAHQPQNSSQFASVKFSGAIMRATVKAARAQSDQGKSPFSALACIVLLLFAGILVKFAAFTPIFHAAH
jgi:hypothetical protein